MVSKEAKENLTAVGLTAVGLAMGLWLYYQGIPKAKALVSPKPAAQ